MSSSNLCEKRSQVIATDAMSSDSDVNYHQDRAVKPRLLLADEFRSDPPHRRAEEVSKAEESQDSEQDPEDKVGDIVRLGNSSYFIVDIFEKEIMELGDETDLNFKRFNKFESVSGNAPSDHHFYYKRFCYSSSCCAFRSDNIEKEWRVLEKELASREYGSRGVIFYVRTYEERRELMRVAVTLKHDQSYSLFFFDIKFPPDFPHQAPSFHYHPYGLPLSNLESLRPKFSYKMLDVFLHIEQIVLLNNKKSCQQMLDLLRRPPTGFEDFVRGHFRTRASFILRNMMEEMDIMGKERDRNMFWKMYIAFEDNKAYCEHILNKDLKEELKRIKEKEYSISDHYYSSSSSSNYYPTMMSKFDDVQKPSKSQNFWNKFSSFYNF